MLLLFFILSSRSLKLSKTKIFGVGAGDRKSSDMCGSWHEEKREGRALPATGNELNGGKIG